MDRRPARRQPCEHLYLGDIRHLTGPRILDDLRLTGEQIGCVFGGPPCQGFSRAGKRQQDDPRNELVFEFMRVVCEIHPRSFMMENVPGMLDMVTRDGLPVIDALALMAQEGGMGTFEAIRRSLAETAGVGAALRTMSASASRGHSVMWTPLPLRARPHADRRPTRFPPPPPSLSFSRRCSSRSPTSAKPSGMQTAATCPHKTPARRVGQRPHRRGPARAVRGGLLMRQLDNLVTEGDLDALKRVGWVERSREVRPHERRVLVRLWHPCQTLGEGADRHRTAIETFRSLALGDCGAAQLPLFAERP